MESFNQLWFYCDKDGATVSAPYCSDLHNPPYPQEDTDIPIYTQLRDRTGSIITPTQVTDGGSEVHVLRVQIWMQNEQAENNPVTQALASEQVTKCVRWKWWVHGEETTVFKDDNCFTCWFRFIHSEDLAVQFTVNISLGLIHNTYFEGPCNTIAKRFTISLQIRLQPQNANMTMISLPRKIQKRGFLGNRRFYDKRTSLEAAAEEGDITYFNHISQQFMNYFHQLFKSASDSVRSGLMTEVQLVILFEQCGAFHHQNNTAAEKKATKEAQALVDSLSSNNTYYSTRLSSALAALYKGNKMGLAERFIECGLAELKNIEAGEYTADVLYQDVRLRVQFLSTKQVRSVEKLWPFIRQFDESIAHLQRESPDNGNVKICKCHLAVAQLYLDCPSHTSTWFMRDLPKEESVLRLQEAKKRLKAIEGNIKESSAKTILCRFWYTRACYEFRKGCISDCERHLKITIEIAKKGSFATELKISEDLKRHIQDQFHRELISRARENVETSCTSNESVDTDNSLTAGNEVTPDAAATTVDDIKSLGETAHLYDSPSD